MSFAAAVTSWVLWTPEGISLQGRPLAEGAQVPPLSELHPRARRPPASAAAWVRAVHGLLSGRPSGPDVPTLHRSELELIIGTVEGCAAADRSFVQGISERGAGFGSPSTFVYTLPTADPAEAALAFGLRGGLSTVTAGALSGPIAVARAVRRVEQSGHACLSGGSEGDRGAIFLVEPELEHSPRIRVEGRGWAPAREGAQAEPPFASLERLSRALDSPPREGSVRRLEFASADGHWVKLVIDFSHGLERPPK